MLYFTAGYVHGPEKLWIIGDNFCHNSFDKYFKEDTSVNTESDITSFTFKNFEVRDFTNGRYSSHIRSPAGRLINCFIKALNEHNTLP